MKSNEVAIKIIGKLEILYGDVFDQSEVRNIIQESLIEYDITPKSKAIALNNNINEASMIFLASKKIEGISENTIKSYGLELKKFGSRMQSDVDKITSMDIRLYLSWCSDSGVKNSTIATKIWILKSFFSWLETEEYIEKNPMKKIKQIKSHDEIRDPLTMEDIEKMRDCCTTYRQKSLLEIFFSTGCRLDEIYKLNISDIDWNKMQIKVNGKGGKDRIVYFNSSAKVHLEKYLKSRKDNLPYLFTTTRKPISRLGKRSIQRDFDKIGKLANIDRKVFPHIMRHTNATSMINSGIELNTVQKILGHSNPSTTLRYGKMSSSNVENAYRKHFL